MDTDKREEQSISINDLEYLPITKNVKESLRVQRTEYIRQQLRRRREDEDALMAQLLQEQRVIDGLQQQINEDLEQTEESSRYNQEFQESMNEQIYALHGVSKDKLEGMREYKNAYYQGCAFSLFLLSAALIVLCGVLHGFQSEICVFMLAYTGIEGALLTREKGRWRVISWLSRALYFLIFPVMMVMFVSYELQYPEYGIFLPYAVMAGTGLLIFTALSRFLHDPYRNAKKNVREAKVHIENIEKIAKKEVRKNEKIHKKEEKKLLKKLKKEDKRQERLIREDKRKISLKGLFSRSGKREGDRSGTAAGDETDHNDTTSGNRTDWNEEAAGNKTDQNGGTAGNETDQNGGTAGNETGQNGEAAGNGTGQNGEAAGNETG